MFYVDMFQLDRIEVVSELRQKLVLESFMTQYTHLLVFWVVSFQR